MIKSFLAKILEITRYKNIRYAKKSGLKIGKNCIVDTDVWFGSEPELITIGDNVRITQAVKFITHDGSMWVLRNSDSKMKEANKYGKITIGNNVNIGWGVMILPDVTIGNNVIIGAGSIVTKSIPDNSVAAGIPCKVISDLQTYKEKVAPKIIFHAPNKKDKSRALSEILERSM